MDVHIVTLIASICFGLSHGDNLNGNVAVTKVGEYMVCKPVAGVFGTSGGKNNTQKGIMPVLQGPMGPPGPPGRTGLQGPTGEPDYNKVSDIVTNHLQPLKARMYQVQKMIDKLKAGGTPTTGGTTSAPTDADVKNGAECVKRFDSPVNVGRICYNILGGEGLLWSHDTAEADCEKRGGKLADLDSRRIYDKIYDYIDEQYNTVVQAWTGMRYEDDKLLLSDGGHASYGKWSSGYPRKSSISYYKSYTKIYIYIDTSSYVRKLYNSRASLKKPYAICSFDLDTNTTTTTVATPSS